MTITTTGDDDETMCYSHTYENKNELRHDDGDDKKDDKDAKGINEDDDNDDNNNRR